MGQTWFRLRQEAEADHSGKRRPGRKANEAKQVTANDSYYLQAANG
jgi:hypothetical protein